MIADNIIKTDKTLEQRGLPADCYFEVVFADGSTVSEKEFIWSSFSTPTVIKCGLYNRTYYICNFPIKTIRIFMQGMETKIENIPEDVQIYQYIRAEKLLAKGIDKETLIGRGIGIIKNGAIVEERFISALENVVQGMRI